MASYMLDTDTGSSIMRPNLVVLENPGQADGQHLHLRDHRGGTPAWPCPAFIRLDCESA